MPNFIEEIIENDLKSGRVKSIVTRFPPEPNGYLHIGHGKAICLNYYGTALKYKGKFNLRFDDTNPFKEEEEYVEGIIADVKWLGCKINKIVYASDYFEFMYDCAVKLIKKGRAYVCDLPPEKIKEMRGDFNSAGKESPNRSRPALENLKLFEDMRAGKYKDGELVLRAKIDMASPNINLRDPVIYRIMHVHHYRQGGKWCIYPMYDFAHTIEDFVEGITHSICSLEFENHRPLYDWVAAECELNPAPRQYEFARLFLKRTVMSKRYLKRLVDAKVVDGWDDPRMPTLAGLRRRGYTPSSIREFCERIGVSKANSEVDTALLESCIRDELNVTADKAMAVLEPLKLVIVNRPFNHSEKLDFEARPAADAADGGADEPAKIRKITASNEYYIEESDFSLDPPKGYKRLTVDGVVRLKHAYIVRYVSHETDSAGRVTLVKAEIIENSKSGSDTSGVKAKGVIHWVNAKDCIDIEARLYDYLLLESADGESLKDKDFEERLNPDSLIIKHAKAERFLEETKDRTYQFLRTGYFIRDSKKEPSSVKLVFNRIVSLKDSFKG